MLKNGIVQTLIYNNVIIWTAKTERVAKVRFQLTQFQSSICFIKLSFMTEYKQICLFYE